MPQYSVLTTTSPGPAFGIGASAISIFWIAVSRATRF